MKVWEYKIVDSLDVEGGGLFKGKSRTSIETYLNGLGVEGWELVNIDFREMENRMSFTGIAKREKPKQDE